MRQAAIVVAAATVALPMLQAGAAPVVVATVPTATGYVSSQTTLAPYTTTDTTPGSPIDLDVPVTDLGRVAGGGLDGIEQVDSTHFKAVSIAPATGATTELATLPYAVNRYWIGIAGAPTGTTYVMSVQTPGSNDNGLYKLSGSNVQFIGHDTTNTLRDFTAGCGTKLYGVDYGNFLDTVDPKTGVITNGPALQLGADEWVNSLAYDHASRSLWVLTIQDPSGTATLHLHAVNPTTGALTDSPFAGDIGSAFWSSIALDAPNLCRYARALTLAYGKKAGAFHGRLKTSFTPCVKARPVKVFRKRSGPDALTGSDKTDSTGAFRVPAGFRHGTYYATSPKQKISSGICLATRSPNLTL